MGAGCASNANQTTAPAARAPLPAGRKRTLGPEAPEIARTNSPTLLTSRKQMQQSGTKKLENSFRETFRVASLGDDVTGETPAGFTGPMSERLNAILEFLWPKLSAYVSDSITKELQPKLQEALPKALKGITFDQEKCHLGQKPLQFQRVTIHKESQATAKGDLENLVFKFHFEWNGDCELFLKFAGTGIGLRGVHIKGVLMLELVGLIDRPPFVEGVRAFLANPPEIDVEFQGAVESFLNVNIIRQQIINVLRDQMNTALVVPNRIGFALVPHADIFTIKSPPAQGILTLNVLNAKELLAMDTNWFSRPSSDPYVTVKCGSHSSRSATKYKTLSPQFDYTVTLPISEESNQWICFELYDEDTLSSDDFLGRVSLPVAELTALDPYRHVTLKLRDEQGNTEKNGQLCVSAEWRPLLLDVTGEHANDRGLIFAGVYSAWNLPSSADATKYWISMRCSGLMEGFPAKATDTPQLELNDSSLLSDGNEDVPALKEKLAILQKHNMSKEDMAKILEVDVDKLGSLGPCRSNTGLATGLAGAQRRKVNWDHGFEFPVEQVSSSTLSFELKCQDSSGATRSLGTYTCSTAELSSCENGTSWRTVQIPGTPMMLKLKIAARYLRESLVTI